VGGLAVPTPSKQFCHGMLGYLPKGVAIKEKQMYDFLRNYVKQSQGKNIFVKPVGGNDGNSGLTPTAAVKTLKQALALATANQNDCVYLLSEGNSASATTDYQTTTLDWNKDHVHLIGVNCGPLFAQRSRVALISTYDTASNLFTLSANGCLIENVEFFEGVAGTNPTGCMRVTGDRNKIKNCHIAGIGNDANDIAGAYSLSLQGADENYFEDCVIGLDTIGRGSAANHEILVGDSSNYVCQRNVFRKCIIHGLCASAGNYLFLKLPAAGSISRFILFDDCVFINPSTSVSGGAAMTSAFSVHASAGGYVLLHNTAVVGAADLNAAADTGLILTDSPAVQTTDAAIMVANVKT